MSTDKYILNEQGEPEPCHSLMSWGGWMESHRNERKVAHETIGDMNVSTVFLGLDHAWGEESPVLWETMVFGGPMEGEQDRCGGARCDAQAMHDKMVERAKLASA